MPVMQPTCARNISKRPQGNETCRQTFCDGAESEDAALAIEPVLREELLLEVRQQDLEELRLERDSHDVQRRRRALAEVPLGVGLLVLVVLVVVVLFLVLVILCPLAGHVAALPVRALGIF